MTPTVKVDFSQSIRCAKKGCKRKGPYHRHHLRHKKYWVNRVTDGHLRSPEWIVFSRRLMERYHRWLPRDLVYLCDYHHTEIHAIYTRIHHDALWKNRGRPVTIRFAVGVMRQCKQACLAWLEKPSKGMSPRRAGWRPKR